MVAALRQDPAWVQVRPPFVNLAESQGQAIMAALAQTGVMEMQTA